MSLFLRAPLYATLRGAESRIGQWIQKSAPVCPRRAPGDLEASSLPSLFETRPGALAGISAYPEQTLKCLIQSEPGRVPPNGRDGFQMRGPRFAEDGRKDLYTAQAPKCSENEFSQIDCLSTRGRTRLPLSHPNPTGLTVVSLESVLQRWADGFSRTFLPRPTSCYLRNGSRERIGAEGRVLR